MWVQVVVQLVIVAVILLFLLLAGRKLHATLDRRSNRQRVVVKESQHQQDLVETKNRLIAMRRELKAAKETIGVANQLEKIEGELAAIEKEFEDTRAEPE